MIARMRRPPIDGAQGFPLFVQAKLRSAAISDG